MATTAERLQEARAKADSALALVTGDQGASPVLIAVVSEFAKKAEKYFDRALGPSGGYAPYLGDRGGHERAWFDDNGWWGLAFIDAYRATHDRRYLTDAARALDFINRRGWASNGGLWWNTSHDHKAGEALASGSALLVR